MEAIVRRAPGRLDTTGRHSRIGVHDDTGWLVPPGEGAALAGRVDN